MAASWTRSLVSHVPRAYAGSRPCAHRVNGGRQRSRSASSAKRLPLRADMTSSMVGSSLISVPNPSESSPPVVRSGMLAIVANSDMLWLPHIY